jgi:hypothetical protein
VPGGVGRQKPGRARKAGVVDQAVDGEAAGRNGPDQPLGSLRIGQIFRDDDDIAPVVGSDLVGELRQDRFPARGQDQMPPRSGRRGVQRRDVPGPLLDAADEVWLLLHSSLKACLCYDFK